MNISLTGVGAVLVTVLNAIFPILGIELPEGSVEQGVIGVVNFIGFILLVYGQYRRKDVTAFVMKNDQ